MLRLATLTLACALAATPSFFCSPQLVAFLKYRHLDSVWPPITPYVLWNSRSTALRRVGRSAFASRAAYWADESLPQLGQQQLEAYFAEGYLLFTGLIPSATISALREELMQTLGAMNDPFNHNAWIESDALLDFFVHGPMGQVSAQLFQADAAHLMYSVSTFRPDGHPQFGDAHYDKTECEDGYLPARFVRRTKAKWWIPLDDEVPTLLLMNQSSFERYAQKVYGDPALELFRGGEWPTFEASALEGEAQAAFEEVSLSYLVRRGDALVHSPCLFHMSPTILGRGRTGFLAPTYAPPQATFVGKFSPFHRFCDSGIDPQCPIADAPSISEARPECFPAAYPPENRPPAGHLLQLRFRAGTEGPGNADFRTWLWHYQRKAAVSLDVAGEPPSAPTRPRTVLPATHTVIAEGQEAA